MWPQVPKSVYEIPHTPAISGHGELIDRVDKATESGLLDLVITYHDDLERITADDENREKLLGDMLIRSAVYAANRREIALLGHPT